MKYSLSSLLLQPKEEIPIKQLSIYVALHWYLHFNVFLLGVSLFGVSLLDVIILGVFVAPPFVRDSNQECRPEGSLSLQSVRWSGTRRSGIANTTKHQENRTDRELDSHSTHSRAPLLLSLSLSLSLTPSLCLSLNSVTTYLNASFSPYIHTWTSVWPAGQILFSIFGHLQEQKLRAPE